LNDNRAHRAVQSTAIFLLIGAGCASPQMIEDYKTEILELREERTSLEGENRELKNQLVDYEVKLAEANSAVIDASASVGALEPADGGFFQTTAPGVQVGRRGGLDVIIVDSSVTFASGRADLTEGGKAALDSVAGTLVGQFADDLYWIEGHTDNDPIKRSKFSSNRELSLARASAVLHYLVEQRGVPDESFVVAGHGQYRPLAENGTVDGKAANRRVEIVIHPQ